MTDMTDEQLESEAASIAKSAKTDGELLAAYFLLMGIDHELSRRKKADECHA